MQVRVIPVSFFLYVPVAVAVGVVLDWAFSIRLIGHLDPTGYDNENSDWWKYLGRRLKWIALASVLVLLGLYLEGSARVAVAVAGTLIFLVCNIRQYFMIVRDARPKR